MTIIAEIGARRKPLVRSADIWTLQASRHLAGVHAELLCRRFEGQNFEIVASAPVLGPRPMRSRVDRSLKSPKDRSFTGSPRQAPRCLKNSSSILFLASARDGGKRPSAMRLASGRARPIFWFSPASHKKRPPETPAAQVWEECPRRRRTQLQVYSDARENLVHILRWDKI